MRSMPPRHPPRRRARTSVALAAALLLGVAAAQPPELPPAWFPNRAPRSAGQGIPICIDRREPAHEIDRAIAEMIAATLLIRIDIVDVDRDVVVEAEYEELYVDLVDRCTAYAGFKLLSNTYPNWLTFTRPFYEARFVVLGRSDAPRRLDDLPAGATVGVTQGTLGDIRFLTHNLARPSERRWRRVPLGSPRANLEALLAGRADAVVVWEPWWWALRRQEPRFADLTPLEATVVSEPWVGVGAALTADRTFARVELDAALAALAEDGTIAAWLAAQDFPGRAAVGR